MRVNNTQGSPNFKGKFFVAGYTNPVIKNPEEAMREASRLAAEVGNKISQYCHQKKVPVFIDQSTIESAELPLYREFFTNEPLKHKETPHLVVAHSFLTAKDADEFTKSLGERSGYSPQSMGIPEDRMLDARKILEAMNEHKFDYVEGKFLDQPLPQELRFVEEKPQSKMSLLLQRVPFLGRFFSK